MAAAFQKRHLDHETVVKKRSRTENSLAALSPLEPILDKFNAEMGAQAEARKCPSCGSASDNNKIYCYKCMREVGKEESNVLPKVKLPIALDIVRHPSESKSKSTSLHAKVLSREFDDVRIVELPNIKDICEQWNPETTLLLYPSPSSQEVMKMENLESIERVVVVDSTWGKANAVLRAPELAGLKHVRLSNNYFTSFWRYQDKGEDHLATIEAIYYFYRERFERLNPGTKYDGRYDDLLYIFAGHIALIEERKRGKEGVSSSSSSALASTATSKTP